MHVVFVTGIFLIGIILIYYNCYLIINNKKKRGVSILATTNDPWARGCWSGDETR